MANTNKEVKMMALALIEPDVDQPRKNFNPQRLAELMKSIKQHGIINPLIIQKNTGGKFILVDGERRYRAATELKLKEVPTIVVEEQNSVDRLIQQFHIQEQHEGWSALEKAIAVGQLSESLKIPMEKLADMLSLPNRTIGDYAAFSKILEKKEYVKNELPVHHSRAIINLRTFTKKTYMDKLNEPFDQTMERKLEKAIIISYKDGSISKPADIAKIHDVVRIDPKFVEKFMDGKISIEKMFADSNAKVSFYFRNIYSASTQISSFVTKGLELGLDKLYGEEHGMQINALKQAKKKIDELLSHIDR